MRVSGMYHALTISLLQLALHQLGFFSSYCFGQEKNGPDQPLANGAVEAISTAERVDREIFFESRIRPLLADKCIHCHGGETTHGQLKLNSRSDILKGGRDGPAIVPGNRKKSLVLYVVGSNQDQFQPRHRLTVEQEKDLVRWVEDGVIWPDKSEIRPTLPEKPRN